MKNSNQKRNPIVYSCAGTCSAGLIANYLAIEFDKREVAEMAPISGIGGHVMEFIKQAKSGRSIITIDGCSKHCCQKSLENQGIRSDKAINLSEWGVKRNTKLDKIGILTLLTNIIYAIR